ncbi:TIGR00366 family protein [Cecembia lonarensis]|uniref:Short-chain fatty acids transporter n=1 Tax=Cecembia lonarensis (strain CCUG 58316 / KCTC 22772 / LW9) TaxID=1225176 RepID=K1L000_CECL9|nr:TIGR00366 family protein [Cecembia lonarensis]EKB49695.1 Short-chain fatty acids transporter [Cecembia lonarensis LW9]
MLVWHGGLSGSSTLKVAESGHFLQEVIGLVPIDQTVFSAYNLWGNLILILVLLGVMFWLSRKQYGKVALPSITFIYEGKEVGRDKTGLLVGALMAMLIIVEILKIRDQDWSFIDLNFVNFTLLALGLMFFGSLKSFASALSHAVKGATDIILQFPFYAGILGMMKYSGLLLMLAEDMVFRSGPQTFPVLSFLSAALVNFFIPSGGGQWAIQGPVMMEAAIKMGLDIPKMIMAFAYGDQLSNMLQPFWALPLLSITGVPAKEIFRYTVYFFLAATLVFGFSVWLWVA